MTPYYRCSPVRFQAHPDHTVIRDNWKVVTKYLDEGNGPWLIDLSHLPRYDIQGQHFDRLSIDRCPIPQHPGSVLLTRNILAYRTTPDRAALWLINHFFALPKSMGLCFTEISDGTAVLALVGHGLLPITEKLCALDLFQNEHQTPLLYQGLFCRTPCHIIVGTNAKGVDCVLISVARGFASSMTAAVLKAGEPTDLRSAGEDQFTGWFQDALIPSGGTG